MPHSIQRTRTRSCIGRIIARTWLALFVLATAVSGASSSLASQQQLLDSNDTAWHRYVRAPASKRVVPARILSQYTVGNVTNERCLVGNSVSPGSCSTVLTRLAAGNDIPTLVIDFGQNVAGHLSIDFVGSYNTTSGFPGISLAFSETLQYLTDRSDFTRSDNAGDVSRAVVLHRSLGSLVTRSGKIPKAPMTANSDCEISSGSKIDVGH